MMARTRILTKCEIESKRSAKDIVSDERLQAEEQNNYIVFYLIELKIIMNTL
jgi:hypothetical protein